MADPEALPLPGPPLTAAALFVCTYVARLEGGQASVPDLTRALCRAPDLAGGEGALLAVNSNYGHAAAPGFAHLLKAPPPPPPPPAAGLPPGRRARKAQGDGTCFNSSVEPVLRLPFPDLPPAKVYKVKFFPTTGQTQIPGVLRRDLSDGHAVLEAFVGVLRGVGFPAVRIESERPKMLNFKFCVRRRGRRTLVDIRALGAFFVLLEARRAFAGMAPAELEAFLDAAAPLLASGAASPASLLEARAAFAASAAGAGAGAAPPLEGAALPRGGDFAALLARPPAPAAEAFRAAAEVSLPHCPLRETKLPTDDVKVSFKFVEASGARPRVNVFQEGKINILGADSFESARRIYSFFEALFFSLWPCFVRATPRRDGEARPPGAAPLPPPPPLDPAAARWLDAVLADWDAGVGGAEKAGGAGGAEAAGGEEAAGAAEAAEAAEGEEAADAAEAAEGAEGAGTPAPGR